VYELGKTTRGKRNGSGPYKGSYQGRTSKIGRRRLAGEKCPKPIKKK